MEPEVHCRIQNSPTPVPVLGQINPLHNPQTHVLKIHFNIILPSTPGSSLGFPTKTLYTPPLSPKSATQTLPEHCNVSINISEFKGKIWIIAWRVYFF
jgi:hypothetical protein